MCVIVGLFFATTLVSCSFVEPTAFVADVDPRLWSSTATIRFTNRDTLSLRDMELFVRHQPHERHDSLLVGVTFVEPDTDLSTTDFLVLRVEDSQRRHRGMTRTTNTPYRTNVKLRRMGTYELRVDPIRYVAGIEAVGVTLE